jgi:hypothetical protein
MTEHPITMSAESIRAIQAGLKHETRRPIKPQPQESYSERFENNVVVEHYSYGWSWTPDLYKFAREPVNSPFMLRRCPYGQPGDKLWVREQYSLTLRGQAEAPGFVRLLRYGPSLVEGDEIEVPPEHYAWFDEREHGKLHYMPRPSIFMPRWASRFILPLTIVRAERLQDITFDGIVAEGIDAAAIDRRIAPDSPLRPVEALARDQFVSRWNALNAKRGYPWSSNPWVWVLGWEQVEGRE